MTRHLLNLSDNPLGAARETVQSAVTVEHRWSDVAGGTDVAVAVIR